ncbi:MAG: lipid-binding SYLF domain-containing protein [Rhodospirillales bacterium]
MKKLRVAGLLLVGLVFISGCSEVLENPGVEANVIIRKATDTVIRFKESSELKEMAKFMSTAHAIIVLPTVIKGGFLIAAEGGGGVLTVRRDDGSWSNPAFYTLASASIGLQAGLQDTEIVLILRTQKALNAVLKHQGKLGADMGLTVGIFGAGAELSTTTNLGQDIYAFSSSKVGLFAGVSFEGSALIRRKDLNEAVYGVGTTPQAIIFQGRLKTNLADDLKKALALR